MCNKSIETYATLEDFMSRCANSALMTRAYRNLYSENPVKWKFCSASVEGAVNCLTLVAQSGSPGLLHRMRRVITPSWEREHIDMVPSSLLEQVKHDYEFLMK